MRKIHFGMLAAGLIAAYSPAPDPGAITASHPTGSEGMAMTGDLPPFFYQQDEGNFSYAKPGIFS